METLAALLPLIFVAGILYIGVSLLLAARKAKEKKEELKEEKEEEK